MSKKKQNYYSEEFKWRVVQEVLSDKFTKEEARKVYGIDSNCAILYWMRQYSGIKDYRSGGAAVTGGDINSKDERYKQLQAAYRRT